MLLKLNKPLHTQLKNAYNIIFSVWLLLLLIRLASAFCYYIFYYCKEIPYIVINSLTDLYTKRLQKRTKIKKNV